MNKKTVVIGASPNKSRYSNKAVKLLLKYSHSVTPVGVRDGKIDNLEIIKGKPDIENVNTVTLYIGADRQPEYYDYILSLRPERVIFNPGTHNSEFYRMLTDNNIEIIQDCTLVMLNTDTY